MPGRETLPRLAKARSTYGNPQALKSGAAPKEAPQAASKKKATATAKKNSTATARPTAQPQTATVTKTTKTAPKRTAPKKPAPKKPAPKKPAPKQTAPKTPAQRPRATAARPRPQTPAAVRKTPSAAPADEDSSDEDGSSSSGSSDEDDEDDEDDDVEDASTGAPVTPQGRRRPLDISDEDDDEDGSSESGRSDEDDDGSDVVNSPLAMPGLDEVERLSDYLRNPVNDSDEVNEPPPPLRFVVSRSQDTSQPSIVAATSSPRPLPSHTSQYLSVSRLAPPRPRNSGNEHSPGSSANPRRSIEASLPPIAESIARPPLSRGIVQRGSGEAHRFRARNLALERLVRSAGPSPEVGSNLNLGRLGRVSGLTLPTPENSSLRPAVIAVSQPREMPVLDENGFEVKTVRRGRQNVTWAEDPDTTGFFVETIRSRPEPRLAAPGASAHSDALDNDDPDGDGSSGDELSPSLRASSRRISAAQPNLAMVTTSRHGSTHGPGLGRNNNADDTTRAQEHRRQREQRRTQTHGSDARRPGSQPVHSLPLRTAPANTDPREEPHQTQPPPEAAQLEAQQRFWRAKASKTWYALKECTDITAALMRRCRWEPREAVLTALEFVVRGYDNQSPQTAGVNLEAIDYETIMNSVRPALLRKRELHWMHYLARTGYQADNNRLIGVFEKRLCESDDERKLMWAINRKADGLLVHADPDEIFSTVEKWTKVDDFIERLNTHCHCCTATVHQQFTKSEVLKAMKLMVIRGLIKFRREDPDGDDEHAIEIRRANKARHPEDRIRWHNWNSTAAVPQISGGQSSPGGGLAPEPIQPEEEYEKHLPHVDLLLPVSDCLAKGVDRDTAKKTLKLYRRLGYRLGYTIRSLHHRGTRDTEMLSDRAMRDSQREMLDGVVAELELLGVRRPTDWRASDPGSSSSSSETSEDAYRPLSTSGSSSSGRSDSPGHTAHRESGPAQPGTLAPPARPSTRAPGPSGRKRKRPDGWEMLWRPKRPEDPERSFGKLYDPETGVEIVPLPRNDNRPRGADYIDTYLRQEQFIPGTPRYSLGDTPYQKAWIENQIKQRLETTTPKKRTWIEYFFGKSKEPAAKRQRVEKKGPVANPSIEPEPGTWTMPPDIAQMAAMCRMPKPPAPPRDPYALEMNMPRPSAWSDSPASRRRREEITREEGAYNTDWM